jgi:hypothetical protein
LPVWGCKNLGDHNRKGAGRYTSSLLIVKSGMQMMLLVERKGRGEVVLRFFDFSQ